MSVVERHLRLVEASQLAGAPAPGDHEDAGVLVLVLLVAALPLASAISHVGRWGDGTLGLSTLGVLVAGRELCAWLVARWRGGRER